MEGRWFYHDGQDSTGPFTWSRLQELVRANFIGPQTFVWREGDAGWVTLSSLIPTPAASPAMPAAPPPISTAPSIAGSRRAGEWSESPPAPWRRYGARMIDTSIHGVLGIFLLSFCWFATAPISAKAFFDFMGTRDGLLVSMLVCSILAALIGGVVIGSTGTSIGKAIFGIKVLNAKKEAIGVWEGLVREFKVLLFGLGLGIPLIALFTMVFAFRRLQKSGSTSWDRDRNLILYRPNTNGQKALNVLGFCLVVLIAIALKAAG